MEKPSYVLIAGTEEDKKEVAKLQANLEEEKQNAKKANDEKDELEAKLKAALEVKETTPGPVVKAIIAAMDDDHKEDAKARIAKLIAQEEDEEKKAALKKANEDIFDTGNGVNTNANDETEKEKEQTAVIATLTADASKPLIAKILIAKKYNGADEKALKATEEKLTKLNYTALKATFENEEIYIKKALAAAIIPNEVTQSSEIQALVAQYEGTIPFNGIGDGFALTGKAVNIDEALEAAAQ